MSRGVREALVALGAGALVQRVAQMVATIILARTLGVAGLGELAFSIQLGMVLIYLADSGVRAVVVREAAAQPDQARQWLYASMRIRLMLAAALYVPFAALVLSFASQPALLLVCGALVFPAVFDLKGIADALGKTRREVELEGLTTMAHVALVAGLALFGVKALVWYAVAQLGARLVYALPVVAWIRGGPRELPADARRLLRMAGPLSVAQLANNLVYASDIILLRWLAGASAAGLYTVAKRLAVGAEVPVSIVGRLVQPHIHHAASRGDAGATLERAQRAAAYAIIPIAAGGCVVAGPLLAYLFGPSFHGAAWTLRWLLVGSAILGVGSRYGNMLFAQRRHRPYLVGLSLCLASNIVLSIALIPFFGAAGSAAASALAVLIAATHANLSLRPHLTFRTGAPLVAPTVVATMVVLAAWLANDWHPLVVVFLGGVAAGLGLLMFEWRGRLSSIGAGLTRSSGWQAGQAMAPEFTPQPVLPASPDECAAVIVNYRSADLTIGCVNSLARTAPELNIFVVENGSEDDSREVLTCGLDDAELIVSEKNLGFGGGCNLGIERALANPRVRYVLLVNPDAEAEPEMVAHLLETAARHPEAGIVGGRVLSMDGESVHYENGRFTWWSLASGHAPAPEGKDGKAVEFDTEFITGALMLIDASLLRDGLAFDENYFLYVEDLDLCRQVRARGRTLRVTTKARLRHMDGGTQRGDGAILGNMRPLQLQCMTRGKVYFARKWLPWGQRLIALAVITIAKPLAGVVRFAAVRFLPLYFRAIREGFAMDVGKTARRPITEKETITN